jgi:hypothetical protein
MIQLDAFLLVLRILFIVLLYLFLMQVVLVISRDIRKATVNSGDGNARLHPLMGHLIVVDSGPSQSILPGTRFELEPETFIGRGPTNTIQLPDTFISTEHTRLWVRNGVWYVQDAGSVNGTFVNNQPAHEPVIARPGDIVRVGYIQFKLTQ